MSEPIRWHKPTPAQLEELAQLRREQYEARLALDWCRRMGNPHLKAPPP